MADDRVKQVKEANDIVDVVGGYIALRPVGQTFKGLCPFHDDHHPSFDVDRRRQRYRCWSCEKYGDVISFVQEFERVSFIEALELLARRAGIQLRKSSGAAQDRGRALMLDLVRWAAQQFHECLLGSPLGAEARRYVGERGLEDETLRGYGLGYAPRTGDWLVQKAEAANLDLALLETVGLIAQRTERAGWYDRFRDRVMFPIRDPRGQTVGFGGRILPNSPFAQRAPKYYNSTDTPVFSKSEQLYGIDQARLAAAKCGYLAVVEGYTDVLMAHQMGIHQVVATMGTALNAKHIAQLRRFAPRIVLVFDADAGGSTGVDRALEVFASHDLELRIATLPEGLDPCDLLVQQGPEPFLQVLEGAVDALEFKLNQVLTAGANGVEGQRRAVDAVLDVIAAAPPLTGQNGRMKMELMLNRVAHRLGLTEETVWNRLKELRANRRDAADRREGQAPSEEQPRLAPAPAHEQQLLQVLLAAPALVAAARDEVRPDEVSHPGLRQLLVGLYDLEAASAEPTLDALRPRIESPALAAKALEWQDLGRRHPDPEDWLRQLLDCFRHRRTQEARRELQNRLQGNSDHDEARRLLQQVQDQKH